MRVERRSFPGNNKQLLCRRFLRNLHGNTIKYEEGSYDDVNITQPENLGFWPKYATKTSSFSQTHQRHEQKYENSLHKDSQIVE